MKKIALFTFILGLVVAQLSFAQEVQPTVGDGDVEVKVISDDNITDENTTSDPFKTN